MELKEFVRQAMVDIVSGVHDAQTSLGEEQPIGSSFQNRMSNLPTSISQDIHGHLYSVVAFDVAVTTVDEVSGGGGIKVFSIGAQGEARGRAETASRIQFATTVRFR